MTLEINTADDFAKLKGLLIAEAEFEPGIGLHLKLEDQQERPHHLIVHSGTVTKTVGNAVVVEPRVLITVKAKPD